jgi:predicted SprT family Zn-dependent metalloprotease
MIDHSQCDHPRTKAARASCRRQQQKPDANLRAPAHHDILVWTERLTNDLMRSHGLIDKGWRFEWDRALRRFGCCRWTRRVISLSRVLTPVCSQEEIANTIKHEIAHALVGYSRGDIHGWQWQQMAIKVGARPERCMAIAGKEMPKTRYTLYCSNCDTEIPRHRITTKSRLIACRRCCNEYNGGNFDSRFMLQVRINDLF